MAADDGRSDADAGEPTVRAIARPVTLEVDRIKGSRFIGDAAPAGEEAQALAFVQQVRDREPKANHHCWAFVLPDGRERSSDDGEPSGTSGPPILRRIHGADLTDAVVVVTRHFGGTKLGTGGLVRAYGGCAGAVLDAARVTERPVRATLALRHDYALEGVVQGVISAHDAEVLDAAYGADVGLVVAVPLSQADAFADAMREQTAGAVHARPAS